MLLQTIEQKPDFAVIQVQVINGFAYIVIKNVGTTDAHDVHVQCTLELIEGNISGATVFPLQRWKTMEIRKFAIHFKTDVWYRYFDTSPLRITILSREAVKRIKLD